MYSVTTKALLSPITVLSQAQANAFSPPHLNPATIQDKEVQKSCREHGAGFSRKQREKRKGWALQREKRRGWALQGALAASPPRSSRRSLRCSMYSSCAILRYFLNSSIIVRRRSTSSCRDTRAAQPPPAKHTPGIPEPGFVLITTFSNQNAL